MITQYLTELVEILIIDDDPIDRMAVKRALHRSDITCHITEADNRDAGLAQLQQKTFDCVFLDFQLPRYNGLQILQHIRGSGYDVPVIMLTGQGDEKVAVELMKAGASDYLPKDSMNANNLSISLKNAVRVHRAEMQAAEAEDALRRYATELEKRNQELDAFAGAVAHDLKGALTPVIGFAQLLEMQYADQLDQQGLQLIRHILRGGNKGLSIIEALLLLTRLRHEIPEPQPIQMGPIIEEALSQVLLTTKGQQAIIHKADELPIALGYAPWIEVIWTNYLSNAVKYGGDPPKVMIGASAEKNGYIRFWVRDNGPGLTPEEQTQLFTPFIRLSRERAEGHGLGLTIVERIAKKLNGQAGVESQPGKGSIFWFSLPPATKD